MVVDYIESEHQLYIENWLLQRHMDFQLAYILPSHGSVYLDDGVPLVAGFLRKIEACPCMLLDGLISSPLEKGPKMNQAIDRVVESLIEKAEKLNMRKLVAFTSLVPVIMRSEKHGFLKSNQTMIELDLGKES